MLVPNGALVLADAPVRLLRNRGGETRPDLGSVPDDQLRRCCALADTRTEARRAHAVPEAVDPLLAGRGPLILVTLPHLFDALRGQLPKAARRQVVAEIAKDLTCCPPHELAERLRMARK